LHRMDCRLSEDCLGLSASHGIRLRVCPSFDTSCVRPLPGDIAASVRPALPSDRYVPSPWFLTTSTAYSAHRPQVCCTLKPNGVRCVSRLGSHLQPAEAGDRGELSSFPDSAVHTLRRIPLADSRTASLRSLPSCCYCRRLDRCCTEVPPRPWLRANMAAAACASLAAEAARVPLLHRPYTPLLPPFEPKPSARRLRRPSRLTAAPLRGLVFRKCADPH
jgi:hypothetical protein